MKRRLIWMMAMIGVAVAVASPNLPCGTFVIAGGAKDGDNKLYEAADNVRILALATNGTILAASKMSDPYGEGKSARNFCLEVPISLSRTSQTAQVGDALNLVMEIDGETMAAMRSIEIPRALALTNIFVQVFATVSYTNAANGAVATLSKSYVESLAAFFDEGTSYNPFADSDGDGKSNYQEYLEGTSPFDETDCLRILSYTAGPNQHAIKFAYSGGVAYAVLASETLNRPTWLTKKIRTTVDGSENTAVAFGGTDEDVGVATFYFVPTEGASSEFFKLEVK